jgi:cysteine-rich repeat protein
VWAGVEECDAGAMLGGECTPICRINICGDGVRRRLPVELEEECDDGNTAGGDGCSPQCTVETDE